MNRLAQTTICGLAATRLVRAWRYERIGEEPRRRAIEFLDRNTNARREWVKYLLECPHCFGFWLTLAVTLLWRLRLARPLIEALAGAVIVSAFADHYPQFDFGESDE